MVLSDGRNHIHRPLVVQGAYLNMELRFQELPKCREDVCESSFHFRLKKICQEPDDYVDHYGVSSCDGTVKTGSIK